LKLCILDVSRAELSADRLRAEGKVESSGLYRLLVEKVEDTADDERWSLIVGQYRSALRRGTWSFSPILGAVGVACRGAISRGGRSSGWSAAARSPPPRIRATGRRRARTQPSAGSALRKSAVAPWIGLTLPRMLLSSAVRQVERSVESFPFEELAPRREHGSYLWVTAHSRAPCSSAGPLRPAAGRCSRADELEVEDLPAHIYDQDGEKRLQPCAEAALVDRAAEAILSAGLMASSQPQGPQRSAGDALPVDRGPGARAKRAWS
jgi:type VI secretion system protein ImpC